MGCSLPGVSAMPLPFPVQVLTLKPLLVNGPKTSAQPVLPSRHSLVAALLLLQLVLWCLPNTGSCGAASGGSGRRSGCRRERGDGARARVGGDAARSPRFSPGGLFFGCSCSQREVGRVHDTFLEVTPCFHREEEFPAGIRLFCSLFPGGTRREEPCLNSPVGICIYPGFVVCVSTECKSPTSLIPP